MELEPRGKWFSALKAAGSWVDLLFVVLGRAVAQAAETGNISLPRNYGSVWVGCMPRVCL